MVPWSWFCKPAQDSQVSLLLLRQLAHVLHLEITELFLLLLELLAFRVQLLVQEFGGVGGLLLAGPQVFVDEERGQSAW